MNNDTFDEGPGYNRVVTMNSGTFDGATTGMPSAP